MKRLQEETMTKMAVLGRGSMRDKQKVSVQLCGHFESALTTHLSYLWRREREKVFLKGKLATFTSRTQPSTLS